MTRVRPLSLILTAVFTVGALNASIVPSNFLNHDANTAPVRNSTALYTVSSSVTSPLLVVGIASEGNEGGLTINSVTYGAQNLIAGPEIYVEDGGNDGYMSLFYLTNPTTDTAAAITYNTVSSDSSRNILLTAFTLSNVDQLNPLGDTDTTGGQDLANPTTSLTTTGSDSLLFTFVMNGQNLSQYSVDSPGTELAGATFSGGNSGLALQVGTWEGGPSGTTTSLSLTGSGANRAAIVSAEFQQVIPEPSALMLLAAGGVFAGILMKRRRG